MFINIFNGLLLLDFGVNGLYIAIGNLVSIDISITMLNVFANTILIPMAIILFMVLGVRIYEYKH